MIVADTNLIVSLFVTGDQTALAQAVLDKDPYWIVPPLWQSEFRKVIAPYMRRGMPPQEGKSILQNAKLTLENRQVVPSDDEILNLIESSNCTAYGCESVAPARQLNVALVTADKQLLKEFPDSAISLDDFIK
jgi:predicted nucleic acid-binding protein